MKKKIVIIGAGCFQKALIEKAKEMGVENPCVCLGRGGL